MSGNETAVILVRILRDLCHRIAMWQPLGQWVSIGGRPRESVWGQNAQRS